MAGLFVGDLRWRLTPTDAGPDGGTASLVAFAVGALPASAFADCMQRYGYAVGDNAAANQ